MNNALYQRIVAHVNRKSWWHVPPVDPDAYRKRGKFLASRFSEAEFWGRPLDEPLKVTVARPLVGDEATIERNLFGKHVSPRDAIRTIGRRWKLDHQIKRAALRKGYDSILLMAPRAFARLRSTGKFPSSLELNIFRAS